MKSRYKVFSHYAAFSRESTSSFVTNGLFGWVKLALPEPMTIQLSDAYTQIEWFVWPTWGPPGSHVGPMNLTIRVCRETEQKERDSKDLPW